MGVEESGRVNSGGKEMARGVGLAGETIGEGVTRGRGERGGSGRGAGEGGRDRGRGRVMPVGVCSMSIMPSFMKGKGKIYHTW